MCTLQKRCKGTHTAAGSVPWCHAVLAGVRAARHATRAASGALRQPPCLRCLLLSAARAALQANADWDALIRDCLRVDPAERPTWEDVLASAWLVKHAEARTEEMYRERIAGAWAGSAAAAAANST